jgi:UDP:flavonoid glycosyltransferase YjiC (YdhE family)
MLVLPFSTDQFAGAAAIEEAGAGVSFDPNRVTADEIADALTQLVSRDPSPVLSQIAAAERETPGPARAHAALA